MVHKTLLLAALVSAVAFAGCTSGSDGDGDGDGGGTTTTTGGPGVGGNVTVGNGTANATVSASATNTSTSAPVPDTADVSIEDNSFVNNTVTIRVGGTVTWTHNDGSTSHTVTADDASFDSSPSCQPTIPPLPPSGECMTGGDQFSWTFTAPGDYAYHCKLHGSMTGTVRVVE